MSIRNILVAYNGTGSARSALAHAAALARVSGAHVTSLLAHSGQDFLGSRAAWVPETAKQIIESAKAGFLAEIRDQFEAQRAELGLGNRLHFDQLTGRVDTVLSEYARSFDLIAVGQPDKNGVDEHVALHPDRIALLSGRPLLLVPEGHESGALHTEAAVAWDGGRAAARALSDSLDLLENGGRVTLLTVDGTDLPRPVDDVLRQLERHGVTAQHHALAQTGSVSGALLEHCRDQTASLLIMGAYEHSKFREDFLGGMTAEVMRGINTPVLLSH